MKCITCKGKGMMLKQTMQMEHIGAEKHMSATKFEPVTCDCCGGWPGDCLNCTVGREVIQWVDPQQFDDAVWEWYERAMPLLLETKDWYLIARAEYMNESSVEDSLMSFFTKVLKQSAHTIKLQVEDLIPGDARKDVVVLARRTRLAMIQIHYNLNRLTADEARSQLDGYLSPGNPDTYYNDSGLLQLKENDDGKENGTEE